MTVTDGLEPKLRNRNYEEMHRLLIETASGLMVKRGAGAVTISALARAIGIHRTTVYYHFDTREELLAAAQKHLAEQSAANAAAQASRWSDIDHILDQVWTDSDIMAACIDDYIAAGEIRQRYPQWDRLAAQIGKGFAELAADERCDADVYCAMMLTSAFMVPRSFASVVKPFAGLERVLGQLYTRATAYAAGENSPQKTSRPPNRRPARRYGHIAATSRTRAARP